MATFAERYESNLKSPGTSNSGSSSFAKRYESSSSTKNMLEESRRKREQEELDRKNQVIEQANKAIQEQQAYQQRVEDRSKGNVFQKIGAFASGIRASLGANQGKTVLPIIPNAPQEYKNLQETQALQEDYQSRIIGRGMNAVVDAGKSVGGGLATTGRTLGGILANPLNNQEQTNKVADFAIGGAKNVAQLGAGTAKYLLDQTQKLNQIAPSLVVQNYAANKGLTLEQAQQEFKTKIDNNGILNYEPNYKNEYEKTGGEIAEIGTWFIPVTRIGKIGKIEKALSEIPNVAKFLGATPKIVKSGGKLFYEVAKDTADIAALDIARGKDWETIQEDLKMGAVGAGVLRGAGALGGAIIKSNPTKLIEKSIGKLSDEEVKLSEELLQSGKTTDEVLNEITLARENGNIDEIFNQVDELLPTNLKQGELAPAIKRIESQTEKLPISKQMAVRDALETGYSEEAIIKSLQDTGDVIPKVVESPTVAPKPSKVETPIQTPKESQIIALAKQEEAKNIPKLQENLKAQLKEYGEFKKEVGKTIDASKEKIAELPKTKTSGFAERLNKELPENFKIDESYEVARMEAEAIKAAELIKKDKQKAIRIATGIEKSDDLTQTATNIELGEIAKRDKDWATVNELFTIRRLAGTRRGQEIAMEKMSVLLNPEEKFMKDVVNARLGKVKLATGEIQKAMAKINDKVVVIKESIKKATKSTLRIEKAQKLLEDLIC